MERAECTKVIYMNASPLTKVTPLICALKLMYKFILLIILLTLAGHPFQQFLQNNMIKVY